MLKPTTIFLTYLILLPLILAQRGGGGGGGHSSGGGGGGGHSSSYGGRSGTCQQKCAGNLDCVASCQNSTTILWITLGSLFGAIASISIAGLCCSCYWFKRWPCHKYQKLEKQFNVISPGSMSEQHYKMKRDHIISLFNRSKNQNNFGYMQVSEKQRIQAYAQIVSQQKYLTELKLTGNDRYGNWKGNGYIVAKDGGMSFWMYKQYEDKNQAGQSGKWEHLVYQSTTYNQETGMEGKWYYVGYENTSLYSGMWKLSTNALVHA